ncbi:apolipoprotein acyltransferase [Candidatus Nitromaritima sp. SCGC AAA799-A02]|nr:apolipoprotein acyltransferase [Candidatus Nitromaritima sp. SCGC AAA799-C22]KMP10684.1 apolipoprotein acyltransferase [Candidatus Nitromaritima sp. SCGC AAA799-A02]
MVFYFFGLNWVTNTLVNYGNIPNGLSFLILGLLAAYLSFYVSLFCVLTVKWSRGRPLYFFLLAPLIWTSLEYLRSTHMKFGFSWMGLGYSQYKTLLVIQPAEVTGVYGVTALIVLVNAGLHFSLNAWMVREESPERWSFAPRVLGVTIIVFSSWIAWGTWALDRTLYETESAKTIRVGLAQGNIEQHFKWNPLYRSQVMEYYKDLTLRAARDQPDLIVWPEAATPFYYSLDPGGTKYLREIAQTAGVPLLFGSPYKETKDGTPLDYNRAYLISARGETLGVYDKMHLVPFGEFVPFRKALFFVEKMVEIIGDFGVGDEAKVFDLNGNRLGVSICYEIIFPDLVRQPVKNGAEFLINITNDAWFGKSAASYQHISMAALRAVENRTPIVRAANTGISGIIDATGELRQTTKLFVRENVIGDIAPNKGPRTFYSLYGDLFSYLCLALVLAVSLLARNSSPERQ